MHYLRTLHREVIFIGLSPFSIVIWRRFNFPRFFCVADFRSIMSSGKKKKKKLWNGLLRVALIIYINIFWIFP